MAPLPMDPRKPTGSPTGHRPQRHGSTPYPPFPENSRQNHCVRGAVSQVSLSWGRRGLGGCSMQGPTCWSAPASSRDRTPVGLASGGEDAPGARMRPPYVSRRLGGRRGGPGGEGRVLRVTLRAAPLVGYIVKVRAGRRAVSRVADVRVVHVATAGTPILPHGYPLLSGSRHGPPRGITRAPGGLHLLAGRAACIPATACLAVGPPGGNRSLTSRLKRRRAFSPRMLRLAFSSRKGRS